MVNPYIRSNRIKAEVASRARRNRPAPFRPGRMGRPQATALQMQRLAGRRPTAFSFSGTMAVLRGSFDRCRSLSSKLWSGRRTRSKAWPSIFQVGRVA